MSRFLYCLVLLVPVVAQSQALKLDALDKLASKASESVNVSLDGSLLKLASRFLSGDDPDQAKVKKIVAGLKGIYVRNFQFDKAGQYQDSDLAAIREQLRDAKWKHVVEVRGRDYADVCVRQENDHITGLAILSAEALELTVVYIDGPIDLEDLGKLEGNFGIPEGIHNKVEKKQK